MTNTTTDLEQTRLSRGRVTTEPFPDNLYLAVACFFRRAGSESDEPTSNNSGLAIVPPDGLGTARYIISTYCNAREAAVLYYRYEKQYTLLDTALMLNITKQRVAQLEQKALERFCTDEIRELFFRGVSAYNALSIARALKSAKVVSKIGSFILDTITPVASIGLSARAANALYRANIKTVDQLLNADIINIPRVGKVTREEILAAVARILADRAAVYGAESAD